MVLTDLLSIITPDALVQAMRSNPTVVQAALYKFDAYSSFAKALNTTQQVYLSNNLDKLDAFFKTDKGKKQLSTLIQEFVNYK